MKPRRMRTAVYLTALVLMGKLLLVPNGKAGQRPKPNEYQIKAAFLLNFGRFVNGSEDSPATEDRSFNICVIGRDPFGKALDDAVSGETINGSRAAAKRIFKPQDALGCRILFISASEEGRLKTILEVIDKASVLTVSELPLFAQNGGMIQFVLVDHKIRFEVDLAAVERARLTLSSELLKIATVVRRSSSRGY